MKSVPDHQSQPVGPGLAGEVIRFALFLREKGFRVFQSGVHDVLRCLERIEISRRDDFLAALRAGLVSSDLEWARFPALFEAFWDRRSREPAPEPPAPRRRVDVPDPEPESGGEASSRLTGRMEGPGEKEWLEGVAYSPVSRVEKKDLGRFDQQDIQVARLVLNRMITPFRLHRTRRFARSRKSGKMDFRRIMKQCTRNEGIPLALYFKGKKKRPRRLVVLADVSGSMERYARFVMPFILGLRGTGSKTEVFVFATRLVSVTFAIRRLSLDAALSRISKEVPDWSGGTRIGYALHQFNLEHGRRLLGRRTVVVILSDGWDLGGKALLREEMAALHREAHCIIWLNPLAGDPDYRPLCHGMKVALPYVDYFLPADSLESLRRVGRVISRVAA